MEEEKEIKEEVHTEKKRKKGKSIFSRILNAVLWVIVLLWMAVCLVDFYKTHNDEKPIFTFKHEVTKYDDGNVESYTGLGYKIYYYNRASYKGVQYGPFWLKDASNQK